MPGEVIDRPNPEPLPSHLPDDVLSLAVKLDKTTLPEPHNAQFAAFRRAASYIAAGKIVPPVLLRSEFLHVSDGVLQL